MCNYDCPRCAIGVLACVKVAVAFGPGEISEGLGDRAKPREYRMAAPRMGKSIPKVRVDAKGRRLCSVDGCPNPRLLYTSQCAEHRRESRREWERRNRDKRAEYSRTYKIRSGL